MWIGVAAMVLVSCLVLSPDAPATRWLGGAYRLVSVVFTLLARAEALATWRTGLVEKRRRLRVFVVGVAGAYALVNLLAQLVMAPPQTPAALTLLNSPCLVGVMLLLAWPLLPVQSRQAANPRRRTCFFALP